MDIGTKLVIIIWIVNAILSLCILIYGLFTKKAKKSLYIMMGILSFICPVVVPLFLICTNIAQKYIKEKDSDMSEISFDKEREKSVGVSDVELEMNFTSLAEAQVFSRAKELRTLIMNVIKTSTNNVAGSLREVIDYPDTEASHYAAVAIQDEYNEFRNQISEMAYALSMNPEDADLNIRLLQLYYEELKMNIFSENEKMQYVYSAVAVAQSMYDNHLWHMMAVHYLWVVEMLLSVGGLDEVRIWVDRVRMNRPGELDTYKCELRFYHATGQNKKFMNCLNEFKKSTIAADKEMLDIIRFFNG